MQRLVALARATYGETLRRPLYPVHLLCAAAIVYFSRTFTLFQFHQEVQLVREIGISTITLWGVVLVALASGTLVTRELEDRTAITLLCKPLRRSEFLLGKFAGLAAALLPGVVVLVGTLLITLYFMVEPDLPLGDVEVATSIRGGRSAIGATGSILWNHFILKHAVVVLEGAFLSFLQVVVLASLAISLAAFFPFVVSVATLALLFFLGNLLGYMMASLDRLELPLLSAAGHVTAYLFPNLGYFNLQTYFNEGKIVSLGYLILSTIYAALYVSAVLLVSCTLFRRREMR